MVSFAGARLGFTIVGVAWLITGVCGQDGSYLAEQLSAAGQQAVGLIHPHEQVPPYIAEQVKSGKLELAPCDLAQPADFRHLLRRLAPERIFHLAAISHPLQCERDPALSNQVNVVSVEVLCEWQKRDKPEARILLPSSAAVFGQPVASPQSETTPASPQGVYARQKQQVREMAAAARKAGLHVACAILYNHESPRRSEDFVVPKVCASAVRIARGGQLKLQLGNLDARRDWGYAPEYTVALAWMLDVAQPLELVLATGEAHSVGRLAELAFGELGLDWREFVESAPELQRGGEQAVLAGDASLAWQELGWEAETHLPELVKLLIAHYQQQAQPLG
jgi:GDPmannose 4,6-dehydratase